MKKHIGRNIKNPKYATDRDTIPSGKKNEIVDFVSVEVLPEFQDVMKGWIDYLKANLKYPEEAKKKTN